ncbi:MAG TPA: hypothetical protein VMZ28_15690, partial [Kofleriaceae bacterium]|nr:hypothetical protein [Kofleriaceae bacterium]
FARDGIFFACFACFAPSRLTLWALLLAACGSKQHTAPDAVVEVPSRKPTGGERILALAPAGADAMLEIDIGRLRRNRAVGPVLEAVGAAAQVSGNLAASSDLLVFVSYGVGDADAQQLVFAAGPRVSSLDGGARLADDLMAFGPPALLKQVEASAAGAGGTATLAGDRALLRARAMAMPERADGASVRLSASLEFDARLALARKLEIDAVPSWLSVWLDVADDLALVALLGSDSHGESIDVARAVTRVRDRTARAAFVRRLGLARLISEAKVEVVGEEVRVVVVVGPRRLARVVGLVMNRLRQQDAAQEPKTEEVAP